MDPTKAIRLAMMVAKGVSSVTDKPLFKKDGGEVDDDSLLPQGQVQQRKVSPLGFYSPAADAAANMPQEFGTPEQMAAMLAKNRGVTDEMQHSGYAQKMTAPKVSKQDLVGHFESEMPDVQETLRSEAGTTFKKMNRAEMAAAYERIVGYDPAEDDPNMTDEELRDLLHGMARESGESDGITEDGRPLPRYTQPQYQLPGGENYREVLLKLPTKSRGANDHEIDQINYLLDAGGFDELTKGQRNVIQRGGNDAIAMLEDLHDRVGIRTDDIAHEMTNGEGSLQYRSPHWDEPNVLAHIRLNDRTDKDGKKVLFVEELQSDWAQEGRKSGFNQKPLSGKVVKVEPEPSNDGWEAEPTWDIHWEDGTRSGGYGSQIEATSALRDRGAIKRPMIPSAPFVDKTDKWLNLALKRITKMAVDGGYDKVAFVNGDQSADRYGLSKEVGSVHYLPEGDGVGKGTLVAMPIGKDIDSSDETAMSHDNVAPEDLKKYVGKDVAKSLLSSPKTNGRHTVAGEGLKVGGEGMKTFYDKIVPAAVNKLLPRIKGKKLETVHLVNQPHDGKGFLHQPGFEVTPEMREHVKKGLPLFKRGGLVTKARGGAIAKSKGGKIFPIENFLDSQTGEVTKKAQAGHSSIKKRAREPSLEDLDKMSREDLLSWLKETDPNGTYDDPEPDNSWKLEPDDDFGKVKSDGTIHKGWVVHRYDEDEGEHEVWGKYNDRDEAFKNLNLARYDDAEFPPLTHEEALNSAKEIMKETVWPAESAKVISIGNAKKTEQKEARGGAIAQIPDEAFKNMRDPQKAIRRALMVARSAKGVGGSEFGKNNPVIESHAKENMPGVIVSPNPGMGGGPPITTEPNAVPTDEYRPAWNYTTPNIIGAAKPPPFQRPVQNAPRLSKVATKASTIFNSDGFNDLMGKVFDYHGIPKLNGKLQITPINGMYEGTLEPSFMIHHPEMTDDHAKVLAPLLGFGLQQDSVIHVSHSHGQEDSIPAALIRGTKKLTPVQIENISKIAVKHGMDGFSQTKDGTGVKFLHFGDPEDYDSFFEKAGNIADEAKLPYRGRIHTKSELINAKDYLPRAFGESARGSGSEGLQEPSPERSDLFRRTVHHVLAPYARAASSEGFRLSPERLAETYGLTDEDREHVRNALYPSSRSDQSVIPLMTGKEILDVRPTGEYGKPTVSDALFALQNRAAEKGQIDPGDYSNTAMNRIAQNIAKEVHYHVNNSDKSAIGWYDAALKKAMAKYASVFPELSSDKNKELLFHSILGITSQGNDVYSNSINAARMYSLLRSGNHDILSATKQLSGTFGNQTKAIETNFLKLHHLLENNGFDKMRQTFNKTMTVKEWRALLQKDNSLYGPNGKPLSVDGSSDQKVTGWSVFGPKIGSFINNLHGNYSTLTADLWFTRTWNRLLGHGFDYSPEAEGKQFRDFRDALRAEHYSNPNNMSYDARRLMPAASGKTEDGKIKTDKSGNPLPWEFGSDAKNLSRDDFEKIINDPEEMLKYASHLHEFYKKGGYKDKSDLRRRAKNWIENRENPSAAPRGDLERNFQQNTVEKAQKLLKAKGLNISVADIQAALWFHEKELFNKLGVASEKAQPADYADAADKTLSAIQNKSLFASQRKDAVTKPDKKSSGGIVDRALHLVSHLSRR